MAKLATSNKTQKTEKAKANVAHASSTPVSSEQISQRAYEIWLRRGCTHGFDVEDWLLAEEELQQELIFDYKN